MPASREGHRGRIDLYEVGDITRDDYVQRRDALSREAEALRAAGEPTFPAGAPE